MSSNRPQSPRVEIKGTVINSVSGEPIRRAFVTLATMPPRSAFTDDEGHFVFPNVPSGSMMLAARRPGFFFQREGRTMLDTSKSTSVELKLTPASLIYGRIVGATADPLERVPVQLLISQVSEGRRRWVEINRAATDADGNFRFPELRPGSYKISAGPVRSQDLDVLTSGYSVSYYPDAPDRDSAAPIALQPAQQLEANFKLHSVPLFKVSGKIVGNISRGVGLEFLDASNSRVMFPVRVDSTDGSFEAPMVPAGRYTLRASSTDEKQQMIRATTAIDVISNVNGVVLALHQPLSIPVITRLSLSKPSPFPEGQGPQMLASVQLTSIKDDQMSFYGQALDKDLRVTNVEPGTYEVAITPTGPWYVSSAQSGSTNLMRDPLIVTAGGRVDPIEIVLRDDTGTLEGSVTGAAEQGELLVVSDTEPGRRVHGGFATDGHIYSPALAPGSYSIYAFDRSESVEYANPDILSQYRSKAAHVTVSPNQTANITVELIHTDQ